MYPRSGFRSGGTCAKPTLLENHPFGNPRMIVRAAQPAPVESEIGGYFVLKIEAPSISAPLGYLARSHFTRTSPCGIFVSSTFFVVSLDVML